MELKDTLVTGAAVLAVGTSGVVGGGAVVDKVNDGPAKRQTAVVKATKEELKEYIDSRIMELLPKSTGKVVPVLKAPQLDYRQEVPK